jgi:hypothetical protein
MACLCRHATLGHRCQDFWFTVHSGLLSTIINVILQVNRSIGKVLWVLVDSNTGSTTRRTITWTVTVPRSQTLIQSVDYC